jgi:hypothetical protein
MAVIEVVVESGVVASGNQHVVGAYLTTALPIFTLITRSQEQAHLGYNTGARSLVY